MIYIFTGPESSGKTTLSKLASAQLKLPINVEYARIFLNEISSKSITQKALLKILYAQEANCKELQSLSPNVICDTDAIVIKLWNDTKFGVNNPDIERVISSYDIKKRVYLVCYPDIPWEADLMREHPKLEDRVQLFNKQIDILKGLNANYHIIKGKDDRLAQALKVINRN